MFYFTRGEGHTAIEIGEHLLQLTERHPEPAMLLEAHRALAMIKLFQGELPSSQMHFEEAAKHYDAKQRHQLALRFGEDPGAVNLVYAGLNQYLRGYPDQALTQVHKAIAIAQEPVYPYSLAIVRLIASLVHHFRHEMQEMQVHLDACLTLSREHDLPFMVALGFIFQGWFMAAQGDCRAGIAQMHQGLEDYEAIRGELAYPYLQVLLADAYRRDGQIEEGLKVMDQALESLERTDERMWEPEVYRFQASLFLQRAVPDATQAERQLRNAIEAARRPSAKTLELRATVSLGKLWQAQGKCEAAQTLLAPLYAWFTQGFDTADLQEAKALLVN